MTEPTDHVVMDYPVPILKQPTTNRTVKGKPGQRPARPQGRAAGEGASGG